QSAALMSNGRWEVSRILLERSTPCSATVTAALALAPNANTARPIEHPMSCHTLFGLTSRIVPGGRTGCEPALSPLKQRPLSTACATGQIGLCRVGEPLGKRSSAAPCRLRHRYH